MRPFRYSLFVIAAACMFGFASQASATIGWAGNVWPLHGSTAVPTGSVTVYAQVWKGGVTDGAGQGADITAELRYTTDIAPQASVAMVYNTDIGSNDEYKGDVPQAALAGASYVDVTVVFTDQQNEINGTLTSEQGTPMPDYTVLAFTTDSSLWRPQTRQIMTARPDQTGKYRIRGLPSGQYYLVAVDPAEQGEWFNPVYLDEHRTGAARVTLADGDSKTQDFKVAQR